VGFEVVTHFTKPEGGKTYYPTWVEVIINLNHVALAFNAAFNIVIYICKDKTFRNACISMIAPACLKCRLEVQRVLFLKECNVNELSKYVLFQASSKSDSNDNEANSVAVHHREVSAISGASVGSGHPRRDVFVNTKSMKKP